MSGKQSSAWVCFCPTGEPDLDRFQTEAAALQMAATLNALDAEDCLRA
jgi:hypothetical protein